MIFDDNTVNSRITKPHGDKHPALIAIATLLRHPDSVAHSGLRAGPGVVVRESALFPKQSSMLFAEPNKGGDHLLFVN